MDKTKLIQFMDFDADDIDNMIWKTSQYELECGGYYGLREYGYCLVRIVLYLYLVDILAMAHMKTYQIEYI